MLHSSSNSVYIQPNANGRSFLPSLSVSILHDNCRRICHNHILVQWSLLPNPLPFPTLPICPFIIQTIPRNYHQSHDPIYRIHTRCNPCRGIKHITRTRIHRILHLLPSSGRLPTPIQSPQLLINPPWISLWPRLGPFLLIPRDRRRHRRRRP